MAADTDRLARATDQHAVTREGILAQLVRALLGLWRPFNGWYDPNLVAGQAARSAELVAGAQKQTRLLERSYLSSVLRDVDALPRDLPPVVDNYPRSGVSPVEVYERPAKQYRYARSKGYTEEEARLLAEDRLAELAETDVKLIERDEARKVYKAAPKVIGYRRVIHPELSRSGTCGLCAVAATQFYTTDDLLPLHYPSCNCDTLPITKGDDPGFRLNRSELDAVYAAAGSTAAEDLVNTRITVNEHGELGPVLVKQGDHFRTPEEAGRPAFVAPTPESIREQARSNRDVTASKLADAESAYAELIKTVDPADTSNPLTGKRVDLFRAVKNLRSLLQAQDANLRTIP